MPFGERRKRLQAFLAGFMVFKDTWENQDDLIAAVFKPSTWSEQAIRNIENEIVSLRQRGQ